MGRICALPPNARFASASASHPTTSPLLHFSEQVVTSQNHFLEATRSTDISSVGANFWHCIHIDEVSCLFDLRGKIQWRSEKLRKVFSFVLRGVFSRFQLGEVYCAIYPFEGFIKLRISKYILILCHLLVSKPGNLQTDK